MAGTKFNIVMWRPAEHVLFETWAERVTTMLQALSAAGVDKVVRYDANRVPHEVAPDPEAVQAVLQARSPSTDDAGVVHPEVGIDVTLIGFRDTEEQRSLCEILLHVGDQRSKNDCVVAFKPDVPPAEARSGFTACVEAWTPDWACLESSVNSRQRREELTEGERVPFDQRLHWRTYFGPERAANLPLAKLDGRPDVILRPLHLGVEIVLGEDWQSDEALRARQRELGPLLFGNQPRGGHSVSAST